MNLNMDSLVNKFRQTVSQVAYQVNTSVNTIIPGNPIHRDYELLRQRCSHGSPGFQWSVYDAVKRDSSSIKASLKDAIGPSLISIPTHASNIPTTTQSKQSDQTNSTASLDKQLYSVFVFDKSQIDSLSSKLEREAVLDHVKKGVTKLTRLKHPSILTVHHPLEESRSSLCFVTEHVYGNLDSILKEKRSLKVTDKGRSQQRDLVDLTQDLGPKDSDYKNDSCELDDLQIKAGLLQLCDGLKFLHNDAKMLHRNLCFDNIFVDSNNTWKISGLNFACLSTDLPPQTTTSKDNTTSNSLQIMEFEPKMSNSPQYPSLKTTLAQVNLSSLVPNWSCSAPEHSNGDQVTLASDIYSLGIISCALLVSHREMIDLSYEYGLLSDTYKRSIHFREFANMLPSDIKTSIMKYAAINVDSRPSLDDYLNLSIFNDEQIQAIRDLDSQFAWDRLKKIDFFNRLRDILPKLSHQVKVNRIAKSLSNEVVNQDMLPYVLPSILIIAKDSTPSEFKAKIFPILKGPFRVLEPKVVPTMLLDNLLILADRAKLCLPEFQLIAFTLIQYLLKMDQQMQEKCLVVLPTVKRFIDDDSMIRILLPELSRLSKETNNLSIKVKCIECIGSMVDTINKNIVINNILPIIFEVTSHETDVIMAGIGAIKMIVNNSPADLTKTISAGKILPFLTPLSVEKDLNLQQFNIIMTLIRNILDRVEREQREALSRSGGLSSRTTGGGGPLILSDFKGSNHFQLD